MSGQGRPRCTDRDEARRNGETYYVTGRACRRGHTGKRTTSNGACCACAKILNAQWTKDNAEHHRERVKRWADANPEKRRAISKRYYDKTHWGG